MFILIILTNPSEFKNLGCTGLLPGLSCPYTIHHFKLKWDCRTKKQKLLPLPKLNWGLLTTEQLRLIID
jgi:hypothetical protein